MKSSLNAQSKFITGLCVIVGKMVIKNIKETKKKITVVFADDTMLDLPYEAQSEFLLYIGKQIDGILMQELQKYARQQTHYTYAINLVARFSYTKHELITKLEKREAMRADIDEIIAKLERLNYINDEVYTHEKVRYFIEVRKQSKQSVMRKLRAKGLEESLINKCLSSYNDEKQIIFDLINKISKTHNKNSVNYLRDRVIKYLLSRGFKYDDIRAVIETVDFTIFVNEDENIKKDFFRLKQKHEKRTQNNAELRKLLYNELMKLKYNYIDINNVLEDFNDEN